MLLPWPLVLLRLTVAAVLGGIIGLERESINRPAGFRTHVLVCTGSALIMLISIYGFAPAGGMPLPDPARLAAQVVSGIGFLGAGTILKEGSTIRGLTTAASLWVVSGIGLAVGSGFLVGAVGTTVLAYTALSVFGRLQEYILDRSRQRIMRIMTFDRPGLLGDIGTLLGSKHVSITNVELARGSQEDQLKIVLLLTLPVDCDIHALAVAIGELSGVLSVSLGTSQEE